MLLKKVYYYCYFKLIKFYYRKINYLSYYHYITFDKYDKNDNYCLEVYKLDFSNTTRKVYQIEE